MTCLTYAIRAVAEEMHLVSRIQPHDAVVGEEVGELKGVPVRDGMESRISRILRAKSDRMGDGKRTERR